MKHFRQQMKSVNIKMFLPLTIVFFKQLNPFDRTANWFPSHSCHSGTIRDSDPKIISTATQWSLLNAEFRLIITSRKNCSTRGVGFNSSVLRCASINWISTSRGQDLSLLCNNRESLLFHSSWERGRLPRFQHDGKNPFFSIRWLLSPFFFCIHVWPI